MSNFTFGFQDDGQLRSGNYAGLQQGRAMGGKALRLIIPREKVQRGDGAYDFSIFDGIVNRARQLGIHPQIVLDNFDGMKGGAGDPKKFEHFVKAAGVHFKGRVGMYSLINEPNLRMGADKYRELYVRGYRALGETDKHARVLFGEFAPQNAITYAKAVLAKGGLQASGFALHPYQTTDPLAPGTWRGAPTEGGIGSLGKINKQIAGMGLKTRANKTPGTYLTEFGYEMNNPNAAAFWPRALKKARRSGVKEFIAYSMTGTPQSSWDTGLMNPDGTPRPVYNAIKASSRYTR
jgi:hypothetical protein